MLAGIASFVLLTVQQDPMPQLGTPPSHRGPVMLGWNDECDYTENWAPLAADNKAGTVADKGLLKLMLGPVPGDWPYEYQWSGVQRDVRIDVARYPYALAKIDKLSGYAHMDIDVLDANGDAVKSFRATTLQEAGVSSIDLSKQLDPAIYRLRVRLIVGGPNSGCSAAYDWLRFTSSEDGEFLRKNPGYEFVAPIHRAGFPQD